MRPLALLLVGAVIFIAACGSAGGPPTSDVAGSPPWPDAERLSYLLKNKRGDVVGRGVLSVAVAGGSASLSQSFSGESGSTDAIGVVVDSRSLKPISSRREIVTADDSELVEVSYSEAGALIKNGDKQSGLSVPEHAYDNDSSLFLWRTLPFAPGYEASYITIITNRRDRQRVSLAVTGKESVEVPAGRFDAWRLEVKTGNADQVAWFADTPSRPLLRYDNDRGLIFELEQLP